jgi:hypothetical protein
MTQNIIEAIESSLKAGNFRRIRLYQTTGEDWRIYAKNFGISDDLINLANLIEEPNSSIYSNSLFLAKW